MGFRFQRRFRIFPGLRLNVSRSGVSTTFGSRGAHITLGHGQMRETVGIPGSGISWTHATNLGHLQPSRPPVEHICQLPDCNPSMVPLGKALGFVIIFGLAGLLALALLVLALR